MGSTIITVIIPVYNVEKFLPYCLESVLNQTFRDLEIILIDDGSTDESGSICDKYSETDLRIKCFHQPNQGLSAARNFGLRVSSGNLICFVDSDDILHPQFLEVMYKAIYDYAVLFAKCDHCRFSRSEPPKFSLIQYDGIKKNVLSGEEELASSFEVGKRERASVWAGLYRRELLIDKYFENNRFHEDLMFTCKVLCDAESIVHVDFPFYYYRQREGSICHDLNITKRHLDYLVVRQQRIDYLKNNANDLLEPAMAEMLSECMNMQVRIWNSKNNKNAVVLQDYINKIVKNSTLPLTFLLRKDISFARKLTLVGMKLSFSFTCKIKAALIRIMDDLQLHIRIDMGLNMLMRL